MRCQLCTPDVMQDMTYLYIRHCERKDVCHGCLQCVCLQSPLAGAYGNFVAAIHMVRLRLRVGYDFVAKLGLRSFAQVQRV